MAKETTKKEAKPEVKAEPEIAIPLVSRENVYALADSVDVDAVIRMANAIIAQYKKLKAQGLPVSTYIRSSDCKRVFGSSMRTIQRVKAQLKAKGYVISQSSIPKGRKDAGTVLVHIVPTDWKEE